MSSYESGIDNPVINKLVLAVLIRKLGGTVRITQEDINAVAYTTLEEESPGDGTLSYTLLQRKQQ